MRRPLLPALLLLLLLIPGRAGSAVPPPTPVPPKGSPSPFPSELATKAPPPNRPPSIRAKEAILADLDTGQVLFQRRAEARRPVASLTKIMTALLTLERSKPGAVLTVSENAAPPPHLVGISALGLKAGEKITVEELLYALLLQSANDAAVALAEGVDGDVRSFVAEMNRRARALGATNTRFYSPNGLDDRGYSTAEDLVTMIRAAFAEPLFAKITRTKFHVVPAPPGGDPRRIQNRDVLLWLYPGAIGGKTGFTSKAGYCLIAVARRQDRRLVSVVLGEPGEPFSDAAELLTWGFERFVKITPVGEDQSFGTRQLAGSRISVASSGEVTLWVPRSAVPDVHVSARLDPGAGFTPQPGDTVGTVMVSAPGGISARTSLVVRSVGNPPPASSGPWWARALSAVLRALDSAMKGITGG